MKIKFLKIANVINTVGPLDSGGIVPFMNQDELDAKVQEYIDGAPTTTLGGSKGRIDLDSIKSVLKPFVPENNTNNQNNLSNTDPVEQTKDSYTKDIARRIYSNPNAGIDELLNNYNNSTKGLLGKTFDSNVQNPLLGLLGLTGLAGVVKNNKNKNKDKNKLSLDDFLKL
jgi:hypothetical protein